MNKPKTSERFDLDDIRAIRDYNSLRHSDMTPEEIVADTKAGAAKVMRDILNRTTENEVSIVSCDTPTSVEIPV